eukprot:GILK01014463.1.p1 GENE.GILK01014463.1~~GILK01014463.1.p1  ORF type:complete len:830 (+),score=146.56 GILK01014463.1:64-2553(+)
MTSRPVSESNTPYFDAQSDEPNLNALPRIANPPLVMGVIVETEPEHNPSPQMDSSSSKSVASSNETDANETRMNTPVELHPDLKKDDDLKKPGQTTSSHGKARHPFYDNIIGNRLLVESSRWDPRALGLLVPCFDETSDVQKVLTAVRDEAKFLLKSDGVRHLQVMLVIDGSGMDQLLTAQITIKSIADRLSNHPDVAFQHESGVLQEAYDDLQELLTIEKAVTELRSVREMNIHNVTQASALDLEIRAAVERKSDIFAAFHHKYGYQFPEYQSRFLRYDFVYKALTRMPPKRGASHMKVTLTMIVKEENLHQRDSILLGMHALMIQDKIPWALAMMHCDSTWEKGSLNRLRNYLTCNVDAVAVTGAIKARNERWHNPVTVMQDFSYLFNELLHREAERFIGMVTHCDTTFSMVRLEPASDPHYVLPELTKYAKSVTERNTLDLAHDRVWSSLLVEKGLHGKMLEIQNTKVRFLPTAVVETDAAESIVGYLLQQRRWTNSTNAHKAFVLLPMLSAQLMYICNRRYVGVVFLWLKTVLDLLSYWLSPGIVTLLLMAMMTDIGMSQTIVLGVSLALQIVTPMMVMLFPRPQEYSIAYVVYVLATSAFSLAILVLWTFENVSSVMDLTSLSIENRPIDAVQTIRKAITVLFFVITLLLVVVHGKLRRLWAPFFKVFLAASVIPMHTILLPILCYWNVADFTWGNRDTKLPQTAAAIAAAQRTARKVFCWFLLFNWVVFALYFVDSFILESQFIQYVYLAVILVLLAPFGLGAGMSAMSAFFKILWFVPRKLEKHFDKKSQKVRPATPVLESKLVNVLPPSTITASAGQQIMG